MISFRVGAYIFTTHCGNDATVNMRRTLRDVSVRCVHHILANLSLDPLVATLVGEGLLLVLLLRLRHFNCLRLLHVSINHVLSGGPGAAAATG